MSGWADTNIAETKIMAEAAKVVLKIDRFINEKGSDDNITKAFDAKSFC